MGLLAGINEPFWLGYIGTADIDDTVSRFTASGGQVHRGPWEIPTVGRLALVSDPQGAGLAFIQGASDQPSEAFDQQRPGHGSWNELHTSDPEAAFAFYAAQFGWAQGEAIDMGPMGIDGPLDHASAVSRDRGVIGIVLEPSARLSRRWLDADDMGMGARPRRSRGHP